MIRLANHHMGIRIVHIEIRMRITFERVNKNCKNNSIYHYTVAAAQIYVRVRKSQSKICFVQNRRFFSLMIIFTFFSFLVRLHYFYFVACKKVKIHKYHKILRFVVVFDSFCGCCSVLLVFIFFLSSLLFCFAFCVKAYTKTG